MVVGLKKDQVTVAVLKQRLGLSSTDKTLLPDLLRQAVTRNVVTSEEYALSVPKTDSVIPCYLHTIVTNTLFRTKIEEFVLVASQLFTRGSFIMNFLALKTYGNVEVSDIIPRYRGSLNVSTPLFILIEENNSLLKQCFLPERWPTKTLRLLPQIGQVLSENDVALNRMLPDWKGVMNPTGWDNSINNMYTKYRANLENHVIVHLPKSIQKYLDKMEIVSTDIGSRAVIKTLFNQPIRPLICHNKDYAYIMNLRAYLGVPYEFYMYNKFFYSAKTFDFSMFLKKHGIGEGTYFPVSELGRKYTYLDQKISSDLLKDGLKKQRKLSFQDIFNLDVAGFKSRRKALRTRLRREYKDKKKLKEKWTKMGLSQIPGNVTFTSLETDGVGLRIHIKTPVKLFAPKVIVEEPVMIDPVHIGVDTGRAKSFVAAVSTCGYKKPVTVMLTRHQYYFEMKHKVRMKWEKGRVIGNVKTAIELLSLKPKSDSLLS